MTNQTKWQTARQHYQKGEFSAAEQLYLQLFRADPFNPEIAFHLALAYKDQGKKTEAMAFLHKALAIRPHYPEALNARALLFAARGDIHETLDSLQQAVRYKPDYAEAHNNLGITFARDKKLTEATSAFEQAVRFKPDFGDAILNLARAFEEQGKIGDAISVYTRLLPLRPKDPVLHNTLGLLLAKQGQKEEAANLFRQAIALDPTQARYHNNLGVALSELGRPTDAADFFNKAVQLQPDHADAHMSRGMNWLHHGDFERGWTEYEWRWNCQNFKSPPFKQPVWDGKTPEGRRVLLVSEQGIGDILQFVRFAPLLAELGAVVFLECPSPLATLLRTCPGIDAVYGHGEVLPEFDCYASLMSLPRLFGTTLTTVPAKVPYLSADPQLVEKWGKEFKDNQTFKVGIVWQGNPKNGADYRRSIPIEFFSALASVPGVTLYSLQKGHGTEQLAKITGQFPIVDLSGRLDFGAFQMTAAAICKLDLVVSCDTACAHLAGALGRPVWLPLSYAAEWRWLQEREDTPWYPTMRLFRQSEMGDWKAVFEQIAFALGRLVTGLPETLPAKIAGAV